MEIRIKHPINSVLFLTFANLFIFFEDRLLRHERYAAIISGEHNVIIEEEDAEMPRTEHIEIKGDLIHVSPVEGTRFSSVS